MLQYRNSFNSHKVKVMLQIVIFVPIEFFLSIPQGGATRTKSPPPLSAPDRNTKKSQHLRKLQAQHRFVYLNLLGYFSKCLETKNKPSIKNILVVELDLKRSHLAGVWIIYFGESFSVSMDHGVLLLLNKSILMNIRKMILFFKIVFSIHLFHYQ